MAVVRLRGQLEKLAGGREHRVDGDTVNDVLHALESELSALEGCHITVFVSSEPADPETPVGADDQVEILPAISGG
jgi:molybdopterin converting factor small subunit